MSADVTKPDEGASATVAREAPTEQQLPQAGIPKKITNAQTVCNEKNAKGKLCNGHLKQLKTGGEEAEKHLRGDDVLFRCQTCGTLYMGPPLGHVRDPEKQSRFVEKELMAILQAAGGTLPAFKKSERGTLVPLEEESHHAPAAAATTLAAKPAAAKPSTAASTAPANETPEERKARLIAEAQARKAAGGVAAKPSAGAAALKPSVPAAAAKPTAPTAAANKPAPAASTSGTDSSAAADSHRPAAEAQAATGQASAAPMSSAASTASPAAGAETVSDLAPEASTELTPSAPKDERPVSQTETKTDSEESK